MTYLRVEFIGRTGRHTVEENDHIRVLGGSLGCVSREKLVDAMLRGPRPV